LNPDQETLRRTLKAYEPTLADIMRSRHGVELLAVWTYPAQVVFCNQAGSKLADLRGLKVRVSSPINKGFVKRLCGTALTLPSASIVDALKRRAVDCAITGASSGYPVGLHNQPTHLLPIAVSWGANIVMANHASWARLDPRVQSFLRTQLAGLTDKI